MGSAGDSTLGTETGRQVLGEGRERQEFRGRGKYRDRKTHTNTHKECVLVTHWDSLISQASSFPGATLPWVAAFLTMGQDPQPFDPQPGTFCQEWLVSHKFLSSPPGMALFGP